MWTPEPDTVSTHVALSEFGMATAVHTAVPLSVKVTVPGLTVPVRAAVNVTSVPGAAGLALDVRVMEGVAVPFSVCEKAAAASGRRRSGRQSTKR